MRALNPDGVSIKGARYIYAPAGQAGEYAPLATNPYRGCGNGCVYCLSPDTLIQMADGTARRIADINIGDDLIGIERQAETRRAWNYRFAQSRVLNKISTVKPGVRITLDDGQSAICSADHRWLTDRGWKFTSSLTLNNQVRTFSATPIATPSATEEYRRGYLAGIISGDGTLRRYDYSGRYTRSVKRAPQKTDILHQFRLAMKDVPALSRAAAFLASFGVPTTQFAFQHAGGTLPAIRANSAAAFEEIAGLMETRDNPEWYRGWLAGIFDAEGGTNPSLRIYNTDPGILQLIERALTALGFASARDAEKANGCAAVRLLGGLPAIARFFNLTGPAIPRKFPAAGAALRGSSRVVEIEPLGETIEMVDITTSTENFIANGMISHNCYVPRVIKMERKQFDAGAFPRPGFLDGLRKDAADYQRAGITEQVMLSFTTDPYPPGTPMTTRETLGILIEHGLGMCTLTKGGGRALRDIDLFRPDRDAFASTLTSLDDAFSAKWERGAAPPSDRLAALRKFHEAGIFTWVSLEPTIDVESSLAIVQATHGFVDLFKVGRVNYLPMTRTTDWADYTHRMVDLLNRLGARHYIKRDLQPFLPPDYPNPLRVPQHH